MYGGHGGGKFHFHSSGNAIGAFFGRSGSLLDSLGVYYMSDVPAQILILDMNFDAEKSSFAYGTPVAV